MSLPNIFFKICPSSFTVSWVVSCSFCFLGIWWQ